MKETFGHYTTDLERNMKNKHQKEIIVILTITIFLALSFFLDGGITGFASFSIYPEETITSEEFGVQPIEEITPTKEEDAGFSIQPIKEIEIQEQNETFVLPVIEESLNITAYINQTDGFSTLTGIGSSNPVSITKNDTDFWILDSFDSFVYHVDSYGNNQTDGFTTSAGIGAGSSWGLTTNGTDFWLLDAIDDFVYHVNSTGNNQTDGFSVSIAGSISNSDITTNGTDFWVIDGTSADGPMDKFVYHFNSTGNNQTDGFSVSWMNNPCAITGNGTDFWVVKCSYANNYVYHVDNTGTNQGDGFDPGPYGVYSAEGIEKNNMLNIPI